jgi:SRSO17 transposase
MGNHLVDSKGQNLHHMLTESPWEYKSLFDAIFAQCLKLLVCQRDRIYLIIDEVGFRKKGKHPACVGQQYLGCIGKNDNGQVAVTAALNAGDLYCPVDIELFMPKEWNDDKDRRLKAGIPENKKHESKTLMALSMIKKFFKKLGGRFECVVFDALYGSNPELLYVLMNKKISFVGDVKENLCVFLKEPCWAIPQYKGKGKKATKAKPDQNLIKVRDYMGRLRNKDFKKLQVRNGTKGVIKAKYHRRKVWLLHQPSATFMPLHLLIRKNSDGTIKYALGYSTWKTTTKRMAKAQAQRAFVERIFEEGKNIAGMADYQIRSWIGFHRHVALVSLALLFLMEQKIILKRSIGKVTAYQIQLLINTMTKTLCSVEQVIKHLIDKIPKYQNQIRSQSKTVT